MPLGAPKALYQLLTPDLWDACIKGQLIPGSGVECQDCRAREQFTYYEPIGTCFCSEAQQNDAVIIHTMNNDYGAWKRYWLCYCVSHFQFSFRKVSRCTHHNRAFYSCSFSQNIVQHKFLLQMALKMLDYSFQGTFQNEVLFYLSVFKFKPIKAAYIF